MQDKIRNLLSALFVLSHFCLWFISISVSGDCAEVLQLRLHLHLCDRGVSEARRLRLSTFLQGQVQRQGGCFQMMSLCDNEVYKAVFNVNMGLCYINKA